jgi:hypothetical protein
MRHTCLALGLLINLVACGRGGSAGRDTGGAAAGQASAVSSGPGGAGGDQTETSGGAGAGGAGGLTSTSMNSAAISGGVAGRSAETGGITAGRGAAGAGATGSSCGVQTVHASRGTPDVLLVLDRSATMTYGIDDECQCTGTDRGAPPCPKTCKDRWSTLVSAVSTVISATPSFLWGLKLFYTPDSAAGSGDARASSNVCAVSAEVEVPMSADSGPAILAKIQATIPEGNTPTQGAIVRATTYLKTVADQNGKFIVLATDGLPNCRPSATTVRPSEEDMPGTAAAIRAAYDAGFPVYVVGIGPQSSLSVLREFAQAGGTGHYFPATSPEELSAALLAITESVATCTFKLSATPPDPDNVTVLLDQKVIPLDSAHGWGYAGDTRTIELHGDSCNALKSSTTSTLTVRFNCA